MRKEMLFCAAALLLCGCGESAEERFGEWQSGLGEEFHFEAAVTALEGNRAWRFAARTANRGEETEVSLTEPGELAGLTLRCGKDDTLEYDGAVLALPQVTQDGVTPAASLPLLCRALRTGRPLRCLAGTDGALTAELRQDGTKTWVVTFDAAMTPLTAELTEDGTTVLSCNITGFGPGG